MRLFDMLKEKIRFSLQVVWALLVAFAPAHTLAQTAKSNWIAVDNSTRIHVIDAGPHAESPVLVLIPGWRFSADIWKPQIDNFATTRRVVAIDPRSQGESTKTTEGDTPEVRAQDLRH